MRKRHFLAIAIAALAGGLAPATPARAVPSAVLAPQKLLLVQLGGWSGQMTIIGLAVRKTDSGGEVEIDSVYTSLPGTHRLILNTPTFDEALHTAEHIRSPGTSEVVFSWLNAPNSVASNPNPTIQVPATFLPGQTLQIIESP
jgi:hypothetical protein